MASPISDVINDLSLRNRAYQVLYALGDTSSTVRTLRSGEAAAIVAIVSDVRDGQRITELDKRLAAKLTDRGMQYIVEGV